VAQLQGAWLREAQLQGATRQGAELQGASLDDAQLQGATLNVAQLQGASLREAQLQGASLVDAHLQGTSLDDAAVKATDFSGALLWRTNWGKIDAANLGVVRLNRATWEPVGKETPIKLRIWDVPVLFRRSLPDVFPWTLKAYATLLDSMNSIPEGVCTGAHQNSRLRQPEQDSGLMRSDHRSAA
jgi:hypothetical protein